MKRGVGGREGKEEESNEGNFDRTLDFGSAETKQIKSARAIHPQY